VRVHSGGRQALERDALLEEVAILRHRLKLATAINEVCVLSILCVCVYQSGLFWVCVWLSVSVRAPLSGCV
jgi:3-methyladenine DNA glycosylase Tag